MMVSLPHSHDLLDWSNFGLDMTHLFEETLALEETNFTPMVMHEDGSPVPRVDIIYPVLRRRCKLV